jgi:hypothetical protein
MSVNQRFSPALDPRAMKMLGRQERHAGKGNRDERGQRRMAATHLTRDITMRTVPVQPRGSGSMVLELQGSPQLRSGAAALGPSVLQSETHGHGHLDFDRDAVEQRRAEHPLTDGDLRGPCERRVNLRAEHAR